MMTGVTKNGCVRSVVSCSTRTSTSASASCAASVWTVTWLWSILSGTISRFTPMRTMGAAWLISAIIWLKEIAVGVVFFRHKELSRDPKNQSVCFEHYPMKSWEFSINYYRFTVGFLFPLAILLVSYLCVLRAVGRSTGTQPDQKTRIRQLVSSTILIFLVCFSPYHIFLLVRTLFERDCKFITDIFNYYHLSLLLTTLNCVADPALYCFVSESARRGLYRVVLRPAASVLCCCRRCGNTSPSNPTNDSREVATDENNGQPTVTLLTHTSTLCNGKTENLCRSVTVDTQKDEKTIKALIACDNGGVALEDLSQNIERTEEPDRKIR
ncbi:ovarian cancer G-protein coupled receptor 1 isoform 2-T4 [Pholidichthys leucotaenia]